MYDETLVYLICKCKYPESASKQYKALHNQTSHQPPPTKPPATMQENPTAEIDLTGSASLCRDNWRKGHSVMHGVVGNAEEKARVDG